MHIVFDYMHNILEGKCSNDNGGGSLLEVEKGNWEAEGFYF